MISCTLGDRSDEKMHFSASLLRNFSVDPPQAGGKVKAGVAVTGFPQSKIPSLIRANSMVVQPEHEPETVSVGSKRKCCCCQDLHAALPEKWPCIMHTAGPPPIYSMATTAVNSTSVSA